MRGSGWRAAWPAGRPAPPGCCPSARSARWWPAAARLRAARRAVSRAPRAHEPIPNRASHPKVCLYQRRQLPGPSLTPPNMLLETCSTDTHLAARQQPQARAQYDREAMKRKHQVRPTAAASAPPARARAAPRGGARGEARSAGAPPPPRRPRVVAARGAWMHAASCGVTSFFTLSRSMGKIFCTNASSCCLNSSAGYLASTCAQRALQG